MQLIQSTDKNFQPRLAAFCSSASAPDSIRQSVAAILSDVSARGDEALAYYSAKFDGAKLRPSEFRIPEKNLAAAWKSLPAAQQKTLSAAHKNIIAYNSKNLPKNWAMKNPHGATVGETFHPIQRVALYVPGGQAPLVSSVLMTATLAKIAKCPQIAVFTPCNPQGKVATPLLAALHLAGITEVYRLGGAHAIAAAAFGTKTIPAVDKIFGPGNAYVTEAKRQVFGTVGVDSLPGPSEVMLICDNTANPAFAAADLLAQAEHGSGREKIYLLATNGKTIADIQAELARQSKTLARSEKTQRVLDEGFLAIQIQNLDESIAIANYIAPEHLELLVKNSAVKKLLAGISTAGAIMVGNLTPTALGDFVAGPSHVLPTARAGRFCSGLRVVDFILRTSITRYDSASIKKAAPQVAAFGQMELLDAHAKSATIRTQK